MTQVIWKFPLPIAHEAVIAMPSGRGLCIQVQNGVPCMWALVNPDTPKRERTFISYGTGHEYEHIYGMYVGTYQLEGGLLVFHVFEEERSVARGNSPNGA